jgi:hypothetical protein
LQRRPGGKFLGQYQVQTALYNTLLRRTNPFFKLHHQIRQPKLFPAAPRVFYDPNINPAEHLPKLPRAVVEPFEKIGLVPCLIVAASSSDIAITS